MALEHPRQAHEARYFRHLTERRWLAGPEPSVFAHAQSLAEGAFGIVCDAIVSSPQSRSALR